VLAIPARFAREFWILISVLAVAVFTGATAASSAAIWPAKCREEPSEHAPLSVHSALMLVTASFGVDHRTAAF